MFDIEKTKNAKDAIEYMRGLIKDKFGTHIEGVDVFLDDARENDSDVTDEDMCYFYCGYLAALINVYKPLK
jgi:hypothetical protein